MAKGFKDFEWIKKDPNVESIRDHRFLRNNLIDGRWVAYSPREAER